MHRESWIAWLGWGAVSLCVFAVVWFYGVFHLLLKIPIPFLLQPFLVLSIIVASFAAVAKVAREKLINNGQVAPMVLATVAMFQLVVWGFGYYAGRLGFLSHSEVAFVYFVTPALLVGVAIASYYLTRKVLAKGSPRFGFSVAIGKNGVPKA